MLDLMKENNLTVNKRRRGHSAEIITDADNKDDLALLANTPAKADSLPHSHEQAAKWIDLNEKYAKTEFMCFKENGTISPLNNKPLKKVDQFTHFDSKISSIESDVNICIKKAWTAIDRLPII